MSDMREDYYEDDEPVAKIEAAFTAGRKSQTTGPVRATNTYLAVSGYGLRPASVNRPNGDLVHGR